MLDAVPFIAAPSCEPLRVTVDFLLGTRPSASAASPATEALYLFRLGLRSRGVFGSEEIAGGSEDRTPVTSLRMADTPVETETEAG